MQLSYLEDFDSKIPAIQILCGLGWQYLGREEAVKYRAGRLDQVVLTGVLSPWLAANARFEVKGQEHPFSEVNIYEAIRRLTDEPFDGLVRTNEKIYHLLTLGTSLDQTVESDRKGRSLHYIDWKNWRNNIFHVSDEFVVERAKSHDTARPDLVLFVTPILPLRFLRAIRSLLCLLVHSHKLFPNICDPPPQDYGLELPFASSCSGGCRGFLDHSDNF